jgi:hypothetical protein
MTRVRTAAMGLVTFAAVMAGAGGLAQIAQGQGGGSDGDATTPTLKFEIRIWKEGDKNPKTVVGELTGGTSYNIETADAVIQIRPRVPSGGEERAKAEDRPKAAERPKSEKKPDGAERSDVSSPNRLLQMLNAKGSGTPAGANPGDVEKANALLGMLKQTDGTILLDPGPIDAVTLGLLTQARGQMQRSASEIGSPAVNSPQQKSDQASDLQRRMDRLEQKIEELLKALANPQTRNPAKP